MRRVKPEIVHEPEDSLIGYARVSTEEQNLEMQISALVREGVPRQHTAVEKVSAASAKRPELDAILEGLRPGDVLVVWKFDRIARSLRDLLDKVAQIEAAGAQFRSITERIDTTTPAGRLLFHVLGALGEFERDLIVERTKAGVKAAKARGVQFGATKVLTEAQIKRAQKMRDAGKSIRFIASQCKYRVKGKWRTVSHNTIRNYTTGPGQKRKRK